MTLEFWFDFHSPWAYLAATRIQALAARRGAQLNWRPLHLPRLIEAIGGRRPLEESPAFVRWYQQDLQDWAQEYGVIVRYHPAYPLRPARALRATLFAQTLGAAGVFAGAVFAAYWVENLDISDLAVLRNIAEGLGLDGAAIAAAAEDSRWKQALQDNTDEAIGRGIFGVPTVDADRAKLFFGNDRLGMLEAYLRGAAPPQVT